MYDVWMDLAGAEGKAKPAPFPFWQSKADKDECLPESVCQRRRGTPNEGLEWLSCSEKIPANCFLPAAANSVVEIASTVKYPNNGAIT